MFQPKLAELHILSSLRRTEDRERLQANVFSGLRQIARGAKEDVADLVDLPWVPTFLPYLLSKDPRSPQDLLDKAIELRKNPAVKDYIGWWEELQKDLEYQREPRAERMRELELIRRGLSRVTEVPEEEPTIMKLHIATIPAVDIERKVYPSQIWGWVTSLFPGNRHRKLLMEMVDAERRYGKLDVHLRYLWES